jgi:hypothetical protein
MPLYPANPELVLPDAHGLRWTIADFMIDWSDRLLLRERQGPNWEFTAILSSFDTLPGEVTDLMDLNLAVGNRGNTFEVRIGGGLFTAAAASHPLGADGLYRAMAEAMLWLPAWRSIATGPRIAVLGPPALPDGAVPGAYWSADRAWSQTIAGTPAADGEGD